MSYAVCSWRAACSETGSGKRKFIIMRRQDEGRRGEKFAFCHEELNITWKAVPCKKSIKITFRKGKSSKLTKLILLSFDHKQKTWKIPLRLLLRTVQYVELGAAADHIHFVALRELSAVRLDSRNASKKINADHERFSCAKSIRTSKLALMRSRTEEVHTWNKQNRLETLTHRSPFILAVDVSWTVDGKFLLIKLVSVLTLVLQARLRSFLNPTDMRAWTKKPKILSARIIACEISSGIPWTAAHICCCNNKPWESHSNRDKHAGSEPLKTFHFVFMQIAQKRKC